MMAVNFKIRTSRAGDALHLNLAGDFDGSSAWKLLNIMADNGLDTRRFIIDTTDL
jgi:hypothetical protein